MVASDELINFDLIETHKENIQQLPGGRSAKQLVSILSPKPSATTGASPSFDETKTLNDALRQEYEHELLAITESDDPLDIYDRYVKWTLNAYPSAQATPQSQLLPLLERATKAFLTSSHYKNDPRYLKLWLHYIRLFSDAPRETFAFLARHHIGEGLALFYEEFGAWLEGAGRWIQADEVYRMGIEKDARPTERLVRKYNQFQQRYAARPEGGDEPSSPALPTVRPALAAKIDPFASTTRADETQAQRPDGGNGSRPKSGKPKMAIFSDADNEAPAPAPSSNKGWDSIGSMKERKKENTVEARPWVGETLKAGKKVGTGIKMEVFKDLKTHVCEAKKALPPKASAVVNPRTGRAERVFVDLDAIYPSADVEYSFEELRAIRRGWMACDWKSKPVVLPQHFGAEAPLVSDFHELTVNAESEAHDPSSQDLTDVNNTSTQSMVGMPEPRVSRQKKVKVREIKQEIQTVKTRLDSPTGRRIKRKGSSEPTMTLHSKVATNEIYDMFNQSRKPTHPDDLQSGDETDYGDDTYSTAGEGVNTGLISGSNSDFGDNTTRSFGAHENTASQPESVSPWSDFTASKHVPKLRNIKTAPKHDHSDDWMDNMESSQNQTLHTTSFDTQAIAALADQNFDDLNTRIIAQLAGDNTGCQNEDDDTHDDNDNDNDNDKDEDDEQRPVPRTPADTGSSIKRNMELQDFESPINEAFDEPIHVEVKEKPRFVPLPPEDYEPAPVRPYRDSVAAAQNKLPFMTPIAERTESSLAPSTIYQDQDIYQTKTPSRSAKPAPGTPDLQIEQLLLSSPAGSNTATPLSVKRRRSVPEALLANEDGKSPPKKEIIDSPITVNQKIPFLVAKTSSSPKTQDILSKDGDVFKATVAMKGAVPIKTGPLPKKAVQSKTLPPSKGPIIPDLQCNPVDPIVQQQILRLVQPGPSTYNGFFEHDMTLDQYEIVKKYVKREHLSKTSPRKSPRKQPKEGGAGRNGAPVLDFPGAGRVYAVKRELGVGAYAAVYLVESYDPKDVDDRLCGLDDASKPQPKGWSRNALEAMKSERPAVSLAWEFHILHLLKARLGQSARVMQSIVTAHECHLFRDECYLVLDYHSQGTILDLINKVRADNSRAGKAAEGLDETVAMWLSIEVLRTMEEFHKVGILHGDLKIDNCLTRFEPNVELLASYNRHGNDGWDNKGLLLIDFGRGIDLKAFKPEARFVADWKAEETDCAEIREARPWKWEIDLFGAAGIIHSLLFGKYIETVSVGGGGLGQKKEWKLKESFKRYWEKEIWTEVFHVLINGGGKDLEEKKRDVARIRVMMEDWLEVESERGGRDLRGAIRRCERLLGITGAGSSSKGSGR